ncbi:MAG: AAA family ATPase [Thermoplasmata archaeon]|nr:AAA family ATPase [Thermoplasmata archaeon]
MSVTVTERPFVSIIANNLKTLTTRESKEPKLVVVFLFFILGIFGCTWIPFFPWWMVLLVAFVVAAMSYGFPFLSMVFLSIFVIGAAGYQTPEFGLFMLLFFMVVLVISMFEWKLGFLVFLAIFLSRFGLSLMVPVVSATLFPLLLSLSTIVLTGVFLTFMVTCGNMTVAGMLVGPVHETSFMAFFRPVLNDFKPSDLGSAIGAIQDSELGIMGEVVADNLGFSVMPIVQIILWGLVAFLVYWFFNRDRTHGKFDVKMIALPSIIAGGTFIASYNTMLTPTSEGYMAGMILIPVVAASVLLGRAAHQYFFTYFVNLDIQTGVGTRISDMENLGESSFQLIGGLDDVKEDIKESIMMPLLMSDITAKYGVEAPHGILLFGPPGCGKTMLMKALANELKVEMITVKCSDIMSKWYGESETKLAELFETARERRPAIIFFDDLEAMAKHRDMYAGDDVTPRLLSILLSELDGMDNAVGIILVGTTNKPELIDPALLRPGRFDKVIYVSPPSVEERVEILKVHLRGRPLDDNIDLKAAAQRCERFSGADLANVAKEAAVLAMRRSMETGEDSKITSADLMKVATILKPSISLSMLKEYELLKMDFERKMHHGQRDEKWQDVKWEDVAGAERTKKDIRGYIDILYKEPDVLDDFKLKTGRGMLLFGPPGCGKSLIMKAASNELKIPMQIISAPELIGSSMGAMPVNQIFFRARENTPSILLIEDIDAIGSRDSIDNPEAFNVMSQILAEVDNVEAKEHVLIVATTNDPDSLHPSLLRPGRFDKIFFVPPPDTAARKEAFNIYLRDIPLADDVDDALLDMLTMKTSGYSNADIAAIVDEAKLIAVVNDKEKTARRAVSRDHLLRALDMVETSITEEYVESSKAFMDHYKVRK